MSELSIAERYKGIMAGVIDRAVQDTAKGNKEAKAWLVADYCREMCDWLNLDHQKITAALAER